MIFISIQEEKMSPEEIRKKYKERIDIIQVRKTQTDDTAELAELENDIEKEKAGMHRELSQYFSRAKNEHSDFEEKVIEGIKQKVIEMHENDELNEKGNALPGDPAADSKQRELGRVKSKLGSRGKYLFTQFENVLDPKTVSRMNMKDKMVFMLKVAEMFQIDKQQLSAIFNRISRQL